MCSEVLVLDHDVLMLFDEGLNGIENPSTDVNKDFRVGDLRRSSFVQQRGTG
jgi:hypothetical protein